jgi:hypothetical protein
MTALKILMTVHTLGSARRSQHFRQRHVIIQTVLTNYNTSSTGIHTGHVRPWVRWYGTDIALISSKLASDRGKDIDGRQCLDKLPVEEENADPDRLAGLAIDCANRVELDVLSEWYS